MMYAMQRYVVGALMSLVWGLAGAVEEVEKVTMTDTPVSGFWIGMFFVLFVGLCVGIGVGVYRADKRAKVEAASK